MITAIAIVAALVAALLVAASMRPDDFRVERSTHIAAAPEVVAPFIEDLARWPAWSPWEKMDPDMKRSYSGASRGVGAVYAWDGNSKVGAGRMEIVEASGSRVGMKLEFFRPFAATNASEFTFTPEAGGTKVTWAMSGKNAFVAKLMGLLLDMDTMIGKDFVTGLANLKAAVEAG